MDHVLERRLTLNIFRAVFVKDARRNNTVSPSYIKVGDLIGTLKIKEWLNSQYLPPRQS